jgi:hypothetical protein
VSSPNPGPHENPSNPEPPVNPPNPGPHENPSNPEPPVNPPNPVPPVNPTTPVPPVNPPNPEPENVNSRLAIAHGSFGVWSIMMTLTSTILLFYTNEITKEEYSSSRFNYEVSKYLDQCTDDSGYQRYKRTFV